MQQKQYLALVMLLILKRVIKRSLVNTVQILRKNGSHPRVNNIHQTAALIEMQQTFLRMLWILENKSVLKSLMHKQMIAQLIVDTIKNGMGRTERCGQRYLQPEAKFYRKTFVQLFLV
nr:unnamed protein product [Callosobruchus chinensis]